MATPLASAVTICSVCGEPLNGNGGCVVCLIRAGLDESVAATKPSASLVFGDFEVEQRADGFYWELGHGAIGVTYLATDKVLRRKVALKVIDVPEAARSSQAVRDRFLREARAAAALRHPNVAAVFQFGASPDASHCYYAMELVEGETLEARVRRDGPLKAEPALEIAIQITRALMAAAAHGLIHRDLKPGNVMLTSANDATTGLEVKVIDFGLAKIIADAGGEMDLTHGEFVGTPTFASPEQFGSGPVDARADIYSLGATLWFALTGLAPRSGSTIEEIRDRHTHDDLPVEQLLARKVPAPLIKLLRCTLAVDPSKRPASAGELMQALESCRRKLPHGIGNLYKLTALITVAALATTGYFMLRVNRQPAPSSAKNIAALASALPIPAKSIAVLPFENRSVDKANAYFADGIQEEILTRLSKIADLKVISRTSTQHYKSNQGNLSEIAKQLGVANILEGSVQKAADQVRINVQLINAQTDAHLWADTYDRKLTDIFGVESDVAKAIAEALQLKLTGSEQQALAAKPTNDLEAYDAYLRGLAFEKRVSFSAPNLEKATGFYERAVQLDPTFALAWHKLSRAHAWMYIFGSDTTTARRDAAEQALNTAQKLQPNSPETLITQAYYQYRVLHDFELAKATFVRAGKLLPGSRDVPSMLAAIARRQGHWDESIAYGEQSLALDPHNSESLTNLALTFSILRRFPAALKTYDWALDIIPNDPDLVATKARIYQAEGDLDQAGKLLAGVNANTTSSEAFRTKITQLFLERHYDEAIRLLQIRLTEAQEVSDSERGEDQVSLAFAQQLAGDGTGARASAQQARDTMERLCKNAPDNPAFAATLSQAYAALGQKDAALREAERAMTLLPSAKDAVLGPPCEENLARLHACFGENDRAIALLQRLLTVPYGWIPITPAGLKLDPIWDPLRGDPRFQKLCCRSSNESP